MTTNKQWTMDELDELPDFQDDDDYEDFEDDDSVEDEIPESAMEDVPDTGRIATWDDIVAADDTAEEKFFIKEWGASILVKGLTKSEFDDMRRKSRATSVRKSGRSNEVLEREITIFGMVQPRIDATKYNILLERSAGVMVRILDKIMEKSGLADQADKERERRFPRK